MRLVPIIEGLPLVVGADRRVTTPETSGAVDVTPPTGIAEAIYFWSQHVVADPSRPVPPYPALPATADTPSIGWTEFSYVRQIPKLGRFNGHPEELLELIRANWSSRRPGTGRADLTEVVRVPMPPERFRSATATLRPTSVLRAVVDRRRPHEDPYIKLTTTEPPDPATFAEVVLYRDTLLTGDVEPQFASEWGITAILVSSTDDEPMHPITMARNFLRKPGGTYAPYTEAEFAKSTDYWSKHATCS